MLAENFHKEYKNTLPNNFSTIAFAGMGGSGIAGRMLKTFLDKETSYATLLIDSPCVPGATKQNTLAFAMSYSGNTWETLEALDTLIAQKTPTIILSHGGEAQIKAVQHNLAFAAMPQTSAPRAALGSFLGFLLGLFHAMGILDGQKIYNDFLLTIDNHLDPLQKSSFFNDFFATVGTSEAFLLWGVRGYGDAMAYRAQTQFNENSKIKAVFSPIPELCHNLLVGFTQTPAKQPPVLILAPNTLPKSLAASLETLSEILRKQGASLYKPRLLGDTLYQQLFYSILWSDFASYHLAAIRNVDAMPVELIDELKARYAQRISM